MIQESLLYKNRATEQSLNANVYFELVHSFPPRKLLQFPFDLYLMDTLYERGTEYICIIYSSRRSTI